MDSLAIEQVAPCCNGKQVHLPQNVLLWRVCARLLGCWFTLAEERIVILCLFICLHELISSGMQKAFNTIIMDLY